MIDSMPGQMGNLYAKSENQVSSRMCAQMWIMDLSDGKQKREKMCGNRRDMTAFCSVSVSHRWNISRARVCTVVSV